MIQKYDPEDIESLLLHKQFNELYPEEKEFVLRHIESQDEYESLRKTLFEVHNSSNDSDWLEPDHSLKRDLMAEFAREKRGGFFIWLNTLFSMPTVSDIPWFRRPAFQVAMVSVLVFTGGLFWYNAQKNETTMAEVQDNQHHIEPTVTAPIVDSSAQISVAENLSENSAISIYPPAPVLLADVHVSVESNSNAGMGFDTEYSDVVVTNEMAPEMESKAISSADEAVAVTEDIATAAPAKQLNEKPTTKKESAKEEAPAYLWDDLDKEKDVKQSAAAVKAVPTTLSFEQIDVASRSNKNVSDLSQPLKNVNDLLDVLYTAH
jgi:hypothetical protein